MKSWNYFIIGGLGFKDYSVAFYIAAALSLTVQPLIYKLDVDVQKNEKSLIKTAKKVMGMVDVNAFLLVQIIVGVCWGFQRSFFIVYTHSELDTSKTLYGTIYSSFVIIDSNIKTTLWCRIWNGDCRNIVDDYVRIGQTNHRKIRRTFGLCRISFIYFLPIRRLLLFDVKEILILFG